MTIGEKILAMRKARGWSQEELAERIGVTRQAVSRWESGAAKPDADKIIATCDLFGVSADYLLRDQYSGEGSVEQTDQQGVSALTTKSEMMTLRQWTALGIVLTGGLILLILKLIHIFKDTNYCYFTWDGEEYGGFIAYLLCEELMLLWCLALAAFFGGLFYLFILPIIRKNSDQSKPHIEEE